MFRRPAEKGKSIRLRPGLTFIAFFLFVAVFHAAAQNRPRMPSPPLAVPVKVRVTRGTAVEIPLRVFGDPGGSVTFEVRGGPAHGRVTEPRSTGRDSAVIIYQQLDDGSHGSDSFRYVAKTSGGVSAPAEVTLRIVNPETVFVTPETLAFGTVTLGETATQELTLENRGGGVAEGQLVCSPGWKIEGEPTYRIPGGEQRVYTVSFAGTEEREYRGTIRYSSHPERETELTAEPQTPVRIEPARVELKYDPERRQRAGSVRLVNRGREPRLVQIERSERITAPEKIEVPAGGSALAEFTTAPGDLEPVDEKALVISGRYLVELPVQGAAAGPILKPSQSALSLGRIAAGETAAPVSVEIENAGGAEAFVRTEIRAPFHVAPEDASFSLPAGGKRVVRVGIDAAGEGAFRTTLFLKEGTQELLIPVEALVTRKPTAASPPTSQAPLRGTPLPNPGAEPSVAPSVRNSTPKVVSGLESPVGSPNVPPVRRVEQREVSGTWCLLAWKGPAVGKLQYQIETRVLAVNGANNIQVRWEKTPAVTLDQHGRTVTARIDRLRPGRSYTFRVSAVNEAGEFSAPSPHVLVQTPARPALITRGRVITLIALALIVFVIRQRWIASRGPAAEAEVKPDNS
jgi:hypothetical protein